MFCAQDVQTGMTADMDAATPASVAPVLPASSLARLLDQACENLEQRSARGLPPAELAFYGGTFTAMPLTEQSACLDLAQKALERGWIHSFRCSTRPDCVDAPVLARLRAAGCGCVELGVQSFANEALEASKRGHDGSTALQACALVKEAGLTLGVQLLPGMPGHKPADFLCDVPLALAAGADMLRFYPCLVLEGTALARMWQQGLYSPWGLEGTLDCLAQGWLLAQKAGVPVIRMGLAPEASLDTAVLAGPVDAALGSRVMGRALLLAVRQQLEQIHLAADTGVVSAANPVSGMAPALDAASDVAPASIVASVSDAAPATDAISISVSDAAPASDAHAVSDAAPASPTTTQPVLRALCAPPFCQGYIYGTRGELRPAWASLGLPPDSLTFDPACGQTLRLTVSI